MNKEGSGSKQLHGKDWKQTIFIHMNLHKESTCKTSFLIKVHKNFVFSKKCPKTLEKKGNIMYLCKGDWESVFCIFANSKLQNEKDKVTDTTKRDR